MSADVFLVAGEASGDLQASLLVRALRSARPQLRFAGVGGERMRSAGVDVRLDSVRQEWASMGHLSAYLKIPWLLSVMLRLAESIRSERPGLLVCLDFGAFNLRLLEWLRFRGYRGAALYYFPPGAWLDDARQARKVERVAHPLTPFAHQRDFYRGLGMEISYVGHPLVSAIVPRVRPPRSAAPLIAVLPGSRADEVALLLPVLAEAAATASWPGARFSIIAASTARAAQIDQLWRTAGGPPESTIAQDAAQGLLDADLAWVASGTAVLEAALLGVPQIAFYKLTDAQYAIAAKRVPHIVRGPITLPNLVLGRPLVPELLQRDFTPDRLLAESRPLLAGGPERAAQLAGYRELRERLGPPDTLDRIAARVLALFDARSA